MQLGVVISKGQQLYYIPLIYPLSHSLKLTFCCFSLIKPLTISSFSPLIASLIGKIKAIRRKFPHFSTHLHLVDILYLLSFAMGKPSILLTKASLSNWCPRSHPHLPIQRYCSNYLLFCIRFLLFLLLFSYMLDFSHQPIGFLLLLLYLKLSLYVICTFIYHSFLHFSVH